VTSHDWDSFVVGVVYGVSLRKEETGWERRGKRRKRGKEEKEIEK
jgi:hypothetical protein